MEIKNLKRVIITILLFVTTIGYSQKSIVTIPNAFTPDGDGINDTFYPVVTGSTSIEMFIYNRNSEVVYHTNSNIAWDGTYKNRLCEQDVYICLLYVKEFPNITRKYTSTITLLKIK